MKLKSIRLQPFAGIRDKKYDFEEGLNVLLGPNEAGKSTVFQAILHGYLTTTSLTTAKVESEMGRYFPASGGDVIRVTLEFLDINGELIRVEKTWKKGNRQGSSALHLSNGTEITDEDEVQNRIESLLTVSPATLRTILLSDQAGLYRTLQVIRDEDEVRRELGDLLRKNLMETGGVSVDRFRELLDARYEEYFQRWDRDQQYPAGNRGIKNPYKVGLGKILEAFYEKEKLRLELEEAKQYEDELDAINQKLADLIGIQETRKEEFARLNPLKEGIRKKQLLEQQRNAKNEKKERLLDISKKWPVFEDRIANLEPKKKEQQKRIDKLEEEQKTAQKKQEANLLKERIKKIEKLADAVKDGRKEAEEAKKIGEEDVKKLRSLQSEVNRLKTQIEAARLTVRITTDNNRELGFSEAGKYEEQLETKSGKTIEKTVSGGFALKSDGLKLEVFSGEGDLEQVIKNLREQEKEFTSELKKLEVESVQEAESFATLYQQKQLNVTQAEKLLNSELGDHQSLEELQKELKSYGDLSKVRSFEEINEDLVVAKTELNRISEQAEEAENQLKEWKKTYTSVDDVLLELADLSRSIQDLNKELDELPDLPEGFESPESFIEKVEYLDQEIRELDGKITEKKLEKAQLEGEAPDTSSEELEKMQGEAESDFERVNREGETLARVREKALEFLDSMDAETYKDLESSFLNWMSMIIGDRIKAVEMDDDLPVLFKTNDERPLTYELLSHGTKDVVALAWRFALTEHFLQDHAGFIILDDPMVDIDPKRRKGVVKSIKKFSEQYQTIVMTCHPDHAEELVGNKDAVQIG